MAAWRTATEMACRVGGDFELVRITAYGVAKVTIARMGDRVGRKIDPFQRQRRLLSRQYRAVDAVRRHAHRLDHAGENVAAVGAEGAIPA